LEEIGIDGFRLDAVKYIFEDVQILEDTESTLIFWNEFNLHIKQTKVDAFSVGEAWTNTEKSLKYVQNDRLDYCFEFDLSSTILNAVLSRNIVGLREQMQKVYNIYPHLQYGTFLINHDQNRLSNTLQNNMSKAKIAASFFLTFPGIPYVYYGEEIGMGGSKPDEYIRHAVDIRNKLRIHFRQPLV